MLLVLLPLLLALPVASRAQAPALGGLPAGTLAGTLDNGLRVVIVPDHRAPVVALHLEVAVGAARDLDLPQGGPVPGLAHLLEHLMYAGSPHGPDGAYDTLIAQAGGEDNAWTQADAMALHAVVPTPALDLALYLEADRMQALDPASLAARLEPERRVVEQERTVALDTPGGRDLDALRLAMYPPGSPDRWPVLGSALALGSVDVAQVRALHALAFAPRDAVLVLVGDVEPVAAMAAVQDSLGTVAARPGPPAPPLPPAPLGGVRATWTDDVGGTTLYAAWPLPPPDAPEAQASLDLVADLLALPRYGPLALQVERGRLASASAWVEHTARGGRLIVQVRSRRRGAASLAREVRRAVEGLQRRAPGPAELAVLRARWRGWAARAEEEPADRAELIAACLREEGDPACLGPHVQRHLDRSGSELQQAAATWLTDEHRVLLSVSAPSHPGRALRGATAVELAP